MYSWRFAKAQYTADSHGWTRFVSMQPHYNLIYREEKREILPLCLDQKLAVIPWSPLAAGLLSGHRTPTHDKTKRDQTDKYSGSYYNEGFDFQIIDRLQQEADRHNLSVATVALAWSLSKPTVTVPIVGATKLGHIEDVLAALSVKLTEEDIQQPEELYHPRSVAGF